MKLEIYYEDESGTQCLSEEVRDRSQASGRMVKAANSGVYLGQTAFIPFHRIWRAEFIKGEDEQSS